MRLHTILVTAAMAAAPALMNAQVGFKVAGRNVQVHGFLSQGFGYSNQNNYLTMKTSDGSVVMTDVGVNASIQLTDRFRVGAQVYDRAFGNLGKWHPQLDWATADYKFADWFGIRGGVVKTTFGLHNDTQDMEFLHTNALLPQSIYPTDLRDALIRHRGGDLYGEIPLRKAGKLIYTAFAGQRSDSKYGGYIYMLGSAGIHMTEYGGLQYGGDLRWETPLKGLLVGFSHMNQEIDGKGTWTYSMGGPTVTTNYEEHSNKDQANQTYAQYTNGNFRAEFEYRRWWRDQAILSGMGWVTTDTRAWYTASAYRVNKWFELGGYYSRFVNTPVSSMGSATLPQDSPDRHLYDKVVTARFDVNSHWNVKAEGHFMDGYGNPGMYPAGFYAQDNPQGLQRKTNLLLLRTGWNF